jgi:hypothetical protein
MGISDRSPSRSVLGLAIAIVCWLWPVESPAARAETYVIDAAFEPSQGSMNAVVDVRFVPGTVTGDTLVFFLHGELRVDSVVAAGRRIEALQKHVFHRADYSLVGNRVEVVTRDVDLSTGLRIGYSGYFNPSVVSAPSNYMRIDDDGVYLRSLGYSLWFPVFVRSWREAHDVSFPRVTLRTPTDFLAVFVGERIREYEDAGLRVSEWRADRVSLFHAQCSARRYDVLTDDGFYIYHLRDPSSREMAGEILAFIRRLESIYRSNYRRNVSVAQMHIMQMPKYGDISSGNAIGISDAVWQRFEATAWQGRTVAHELVHSFVQTRSSNDMGAFVIEGFPGYFHLPALAEILGEQWYRDFLEQVELSYVNKRKTGKNRRGNALPREIPILEIGIDDIGEYKDTFVLNDRVKLFFDQLRRGMGKEEFFQFSSDLLNRDSLDYDIFTSVVESHLPDSRQVVARWLKSTEYPVEPVADGQ